MKSTTFFLVLSVFFIQSSYSEPLVYHNIYLSYVSTSLAQSIAHYAKQQQLGGLSFWELRGDTGFDEDSSLLKSINTVFSGYEVSGKKPIILSYWSNKNTYSKDQSTQDINHPPYAIPGSRDAEGNTVTNSDFYHKLNGVNHIAYRFLQAQTETYRYYDNKTDHMITVNNKTPENIGTLYFSDPWSDLSTSGVSSIQDAFCRKNTAICDFSLTNRINPIPIESGAQMGNFNAFSTLEHPTDSNALGPLKKLISIGGFHHEATFEETFKSPTARENFINSAIAILEAYQLDGIDLDYENPQMTAENADNFARFVQQLKEALPEKLVSITLLLDRDATNLIDNTTAGFSKENLHKMAQHATIINLKTHNSYGPYSDAPNEAKITEFITHLASPSNAPDHHNPSIDKRVTAAIDAGLKPSQITISIPAYGQAIAGIDNTNNGLFNIISKNASIPVGDLDSANCQTEIDPVTSSSCSGTFQYNYLYNEMLPYDFIETNHQSDHLVIGTSAYADYWSPRRVPYFDLKITNAGQQNDINFNVLIGDFVAPDFYNTGTVKMYDRQITHQINGKQNLSVKWATNWGPSGVCNSTLNFTKNKHIIIKVTPDTLQGKYKTFCSFHDLSN